MLLQLHCERTGLPLVDLPLARLCRNQWQHADLDLEALHPRAELLWVHRLGKAVVVAVAVQGQAAVVLQRDRKAWRLQD